MNINTPPWTLLSRELNVHHLRKLTLSLLEKLSLMMLMQIWNCDRGRDRDLRTNILTEDHFKKNAYSRMRVHLAVQVFSNSMSMMIKAHAEKCGGLDKYASLLLIVEKLDR